MGCLGADSFRAPPHSGTWCVEVCGCVPPLVQRTSSSSNLLRSTALLATDAVRPPPPRAVLCRTVRASPGFLFFAFLVSWGNIPPPPGMEQGWKDPYPVSVRLVELLRWTLLIVFQVRTL